MILHGNMKMLQLKIFENMKTRVQKKWTKLRDRLSQQLQTSWCLYGNLSTAECF